MKYFPPFPSQCSYITGCRRYRENGEFARDVALGHDLLKNAINDAHMAARGKAPPLKGFLPVLPTNVYVRDMKTGRFVKWRN